MQIRWKLRIAAAQREVWTGSQLRRLLAERAGLEMSSASVSALFARQPSQLKLTTLAGVVHRSAVHPGRPVRPRHHPGGTARTVISGHPRSRRARSRPGPVDAADLRRAAGDSQDQRLRPLRQAGRHLRPRASRPLPLRPGPPPGQEPVPGLQPVQEAGRGNRQVRLVLADMRPLRRENRTGRPRSLQPVPDQRPAGQCPAALPAVRQARPDPRGHRLVRALLPAPAGHPALMPPAGPVAWSRTWRATGSASPAIPGLRTGSRSGLRTSPPGSATRRHGCRAWRTTSRPATTPPPPAR